MMATVIPYAEPDLSKLTEEERLQILSVIQRDEELRQKDLCRIEQLQMDIQKYKEMVNDSKSGKSSYCACCHIEFFWLIRRGELCPRCQRKVCDKCHCLVAGLTMVNKQSQEWLCVLCYKELELRLVSGAWFYHGLRIRRSRRHRRTNSDVGPLTDYDISLAVSLPTARQDIVSVGDEASDTESSEGYLSQPCKHILAGADADNAAVAFPRNDDEATLQLLLSSGYSSPLKQPATGNYINDNILLTYDVKKDTDKVQRHKWTTRLLDQSKEKEDVAEEDKWEIISTLSFVTEENDKGGTLDEVDHGKQDLQRNFLKPSHQLAVPSINTGKIQSVTSTQPHTISKSTVRKMIISETTLTKPVRDTQLTTMTVKTDNSGMKQRGFQPIANSGGYICQNKMKANVIYDNDDDDDDDDDDNTDDEDEDGDSDEDKYMANKQHLRLFNDDDDALSVISEDTEPSEHSLLSLGSVEDCDVQDLQQIINLVAEKEILKYKSSNGEHLHEEFDVIADYNMMVICSRDHWTPNMTSGNVVHQQTTDNYAPLLPDTSEISFADRLRKFISSIDPRPLFSNKMKADAEDDTVRVTYTAPDKLEPFDEQHSPCTQSLDETMQSSNLRSMTECQVETINPANERVISTQIPDTKKQIQAEATHSKTQSQVEAIEPTSVRVISTQIPVTKKHIQAEATHSKTQSQVKTIEPTSVRVISTQIPDTKKQIQAEATHSKTQSQVETIEPTSVRVISTQTPDTKKQIQTEATGSTSKIGTYHQTLEASDVSVIQTMTATKSDVAIESEAAIRYNAQCSGVEECSADGVVIVKTAKQSEAIKPAEVYATVEQSAVASDESHMKMKPEDVSGRNLQMEHHNISCKLIANPVAVADPSQLVPRKTDESHLKMSDKIEIFTSEPEIKCIKYNETLKTMCESGNEPAEQLKIKLSEPSRKLETDNQTVARSETTKSARSESYRKCETLDTVSKSDKDNETVEQVRIQMNEEHHKSDDEKTEPKQIKINESKWKVDDDDEEIIKPLRIIDSQNIYKDNETIESLRIVVNHYNEDNKTMELIMAEGGEAQWRSTEDNETVEPFQTDGSCSSYKDSEIKQPVTIEDNESQRISYDDMKKPTKVKVSLSHQRSDEDKETVEPEYGFEAVDPYSKAESFQRVKVANDFHVHVDEHEKATSPREQTDDNTHKAVLAKILLSQDESEASVESYSLLSSDGPGPTLGSNQFDHQVSSSAQRRPIFNLELTSDKMDDEVDETPVCSPSSPGDKDVAHLGYSRSRSQLSCKTSGSQESILSTYSNPGVIGKIAVTGDICCQISYSTQYRMLDIGVKQCRNLAAVHRKRKQSNPYVKVYLLPDKTRAGKRKTKVIRNNLNPEFNETLQFDITENSVADRTLWIAVWHNDRIGRNVFLGDTVIPLREFGFDNEPHWYRLQQQGRELWRSELNLAHKAELELSLKYVNTENVKSRESRGKRKLTVNGQLLVIIKQAHNLMSPRESGIINAFCKLRLLSCRPKHHQHKTAVVKHDCNPVWNQEIVFTDIDINDLQSDCSLEVTVWDHERFTTSNFLGAVHLNSGCTASNIKGWLNAHVEEQQLWQKFLQAPNDLAEAILPLRPNTD